MLYSDSITIEQLRVFLAIVEEGSFSKAAKKLHRAQSAISYSMATLENLLDIMIFDRSTRLPTLTEEGEKLLPHAKQVLNSMFNFQQQAQKIQSKEETDISIVVDAAFPVKKLAKMCLLFQQQFPNIRLHLKTVMFEKVVDGVLSDEFDLGISAPLFQEHSTIIQKKILSFSIYNVAGKNHPLAKIDGTISRDVLRKHMQIVVSHSPEKKIQTGINIWAEEIWHVADLSTKKELILAGVGWGGLPYHMIQEELDNDSLVILDIKDSLRPMNFMIIQKHNRILGQGAKWITEYWQDND